MDNTDGSRYWGVFWVDVSTTDSAQMGFAAISRKIGSSLDTTDEKWLLILDHADDPNFDYTAYIPSSKQGSVLITSRNVDSQLGHVTAKSMNLHSLGMSQSLELLQKVAKIPSGKWLKAQGIAGLLGFNPFALVQAGAYMSGSLCMIDQCLQEIEKHSGDDCNALRSIDRPVSIRNPIQAPLEATARQLEYYHGTTGQNALKLLSIMCMLHHSGFPANSVKDALKTQGIAAIAASDDRSQLRQYQRTHFHEPFSVENSYSILESYSLISINSNNENEQEIFIHPLIQEWMRDRQNASEQLSSWIMAGSVLVMSKEWSDIHSAHAYAFFSLRTRILDQNPKPLPRGLSSMVTTILCRIIHLLAHNDNRTPDNPRLAPVIDDVFCIMDTDPLLGPFKDLVPLFRGCIPAGASPHRIKPLIQLLEKNSTLNSPGKNWHLYLAKAYFRIGQPRQAAALLESLMKVQYGLTRSDASIAHAILAVAHRQTGQLHKAICHQQQATGIAQEVLDPAQPYIWSNMVFLGWLFGENGQVDAALDTLEYALKYQDRMYGVGNDYSLVTRHYIALLCRRHGRLPRAIEVQREAVALWRRRELPDAHPLRLRAEHCLATFYMLGRRWREAVRLLVSLEDTYRGEMEEVRAVNDFVQVLWNLGICYRERGRWRKARDVMEEVVSILDTGSTEQQRAKELLLEIRRQRRSAG